MASAMSPLTEGRGLKHGHLRPVGQIERVAPHGGAWIETARSERSGEERNMSPLTEGRGLKREVEYYNKDGELSPLTEGRGLKREEEYYNKDGELSPLTEGRGLKL